MPYADLTVVFGNRSIDRGHAVTWHWPVVHRADFLHLWQAFRVRPLGVDEEVIVVWAASDHTGFIERIFASFLPRINVMVCPKGSYTNFPTWDERVRHGKAPDLTLLNPLAVWFAKQHGRITGEAA
jgi:hypothetical protein